MRTGTNIFSYKRSYIEPCGTGVVFINFDIWINNFWFELWSLAKLVVVGATFDYSLFGERRSIKKIVMLM